MKLRSGAGRNEKGSDIRHAPDESPEASWSSRVTTGLYWAFLLFVLVLLGRFIYVRMAYYEAPGIVRVSKLKVGVPQAGTVGRIPVSEGDTVAVGDTLLRIAPPASCRRATVPSIWSVRTELRSLRAELENVERRIRWTREDLEKARRRRTLRLRGSREEIDQLRARLRELRSERSLLKARLAGASDRMDSLQAHAKQPSGCESAARTASVDGVINTIYLTEDQSVQVGDVFATLEPRRTEVRAIGYLDEDLSRHVEVGELVTVTLPNDSTAAGRIDRLLSSASQFPDVQYDGHRPLPTHLLAIIRPVADEDRRRLRRFDQMDVEVTGREPFALLKSMGWLPGL